MAKLVALSTALAIVALAIAGAASAEAAALKRFVFAKRIADPGSVLAFTVSCPPGWAEMGGNVISNPAAMPVLASRPSFVKSAVRRRFFAFDNRGGATPAEVRVRITCIKFTPPPRAKRGPLRIGTLTIVRTPFKPVKGQPRTIKTPVCPKRGRLVSPGLELRLVEGRTEKQGAWASVRKTGAAVEISKSWVSQTKRGERAEYVVEDSGGVDDYEVRALGRCLERIASTPRRKGSRQAPYRGPIGIRIPYLRGSIAPGSNQVKANCPKGFLSIGTGFMFPPGKGVSLFRSFPLGGRSLGWEIDSPAPMELLIKIQAQCLDSQSP